MRLFSSSPVSGRLAALGCLLVFLTLPLAAQSELDLPGGTGLQPKPSRYGPQRNDPNNGHPRHAYSPFEHVNDPPPRQPAPGRDFMEGQLVIKLAPNVTVNAGHSSAPATLPSPGAQAAAGLTDLPALNSILKAQGVVALEPVIRNAKAPVPQVVAPGAKPGKPDLTRWFRAKLAAKTTVPAALSKLTNAPGVECAEPDYLRKLAGGPANPSRQRHQGSAADLPASGSDPLYAQQWHLAACKLPEAWAYLQSQGLPPGGSRDIVVAVIDTGVDYTHPDLAANMWTNSREIAGNGIDDDHNGFVDDVHGCNVVGTHSGNPMDDHGHGTHVAGIIAAQAGNGIGGVGVAYNVQIMAIKAAQYSGVLAASDIAEGINYAVANGADIINMSFGGYAKSQVEEDALTVAFGQCVLVAAAGNDGIANEGPCIPSRAMYPAAYNWVLGVMASTPSGGLAPFSNFDCVPHTKVEYEVMAPGVDIWSTLPNNQYAAWDGTSMSAPIVSGIAALARTRWTDKDVYSSRFIMGQIAMDAGALANAVNVLTNTPKPELSYLEHWLFDTTAQAAIDDNDGIVDAGETIDLAIVIRNHWGKADPVIVTLDAWATGAVQADPYVTMITNVVDYGAIGSFNWDDNGLIYDAQGVITGVRHPFRFQVATNCPNDHVIPFRLNMSCRNGLDPADATIYTFQSRFALVVQRGRQLPRIITQDMVLTSDDLWLVPGQTLIQQGVTVTVMEGTQVQWGSPDPNNPYSTPMISYIQVEGTLLSQGTYDNPVEFFPSPIVAWGANTYIKNVSGRGTTQLAYTRVRNPQLGLYGMYDKLTSLDHCYIDWDAGCWGLGSTLCTRTIVHKIRGGGCGNRAFGLESIDGCLFDSSWLDSDWWLQRITNSVFLQDNENNHPVRWSITGYSTTNEVGAMADTHWRNNAFLSKYWDPNVNHWMRISPYYSWNRSQYAGIVSNYWGTTSTTLIDAAITDFNDDFNMAHVVYAPFLTVPSQSTFPFVTDVRLSTAGGTNMSSVGAELVTFTVSYNRDMDTNALPQVTFGPDTPVTDYTVHPIGGGWRDARTWMGTFNVNPITGDGYQLMRIAGGRAADDPWLVCGDDSGRFRFEIVTSGTESMNLQATGGEGKVDLNWMQDDFALLAGYSLYRSTNPTNNFARINTALIPSQQKTFTDRSVQPGKPYYYKFTVVKTDMSESDFSNLAQGTPLDTIPPVIVHTPITSASPGMPLTIFADVTDNVGVQGVTLFFRAKGSTGYQNRTMTLVSGSRYAATIEGSRLNSPGLDYYIEATDGVSIVRSGRPELPNTAVVVDQPVVTAVSPTSGPASGGTPLTVAGANLKSGATVAVGGVAAGNVVWVSSSQLTCVSPAHFPAAADVKVTNPDGQSGTLLRAFVFVSDTVSLSLPNTGGAQGDVVSIPLNAASVQGLAAADITVSFDPAVLKGRGGRTGTLTPGWSLVANTNTAGQVRLSLASPGGTATGDGSLASLDLEVIGAPGASSALHLTTVSLNDGAIRLQTADGSFAVALAYKVSGAVRFWNGGAGVTGVQESLSGDRVFSSTSAANGTYTVGGAPVGAYTLTPRKSDMAFAITAYDASLVLQHAAGLTNLTGSAAIAADVDKSGSITSMDAFYILQKAVELITLPFPGAGVVWDFSPTTRSYPNLNADVAGQDFTAILLGDVSGNWTAGGGLASIVRNSASTSSRQAALADLQAPEPALAVYHSLKGTLGTRARVLVRAPGAGIYSIDLKLAYDASSSLQSVRAGGMARMMLVANNTNAAGIVRSSLAGALPLQGIGELLEVDFAGQATNGLRIAEVLINEGQVPATIDPDTASFQADSDGDGQSDLNEILAGTDPLNKDSVFKVTEIRVGPDRTATLTWSAVPGRLYQLEWKDALGDATWNAAGAAVNANGNTASVMDRPAGADTGRIYRVRLVE